MTFKEGGEVPDTFWKTYLEVSVAQYIPHIKKTVGKIVGLSDN